MRAGRDSRDLVPDRALTRSRRLLVLVLGWCGAVLVATVARPLELDHAWRFFFPPQLAGWSIGGFARFWASTAVSGAWLAAVGLAVAGAGGILVRAAPRSVPAPLKFHLAWILGQFALVFLTMGLGLTGLLHRGTLIAIVGGLALGALPRAIRWTAGLRIPRSGEAGWAGSVLGVLAAAGMGTALLAVLLPQVSFDALAYYFADPRAYLDGHRWTARMCVPHDGLPPLFQQLFVLVFAVDAFAGGVSPGSGDVAARMLNGLEFVLAGVALDGLLRWRGAGTISRALALAAVATMPLAGQMTAFTYNDWAVVHGAVAGFWLLLAGSARPAVFVAGWLLAVKLSAVIVAAPLAALSMLSCRRRTPGLAALAGLCLVPWFLRNAYVHGQPFYPFFWRALESFETRYVLDPDADVAGFIRDFGFTHGALDWLSRPWFAHLGVHRVVDHTQNLVSPASLILIPVVLGIGRGAGWWLVAGGLLLWMGLGGGLVRYLMPVVACAAAEGAFRLHAKKLVRLAVVVALPFLALQLLHAWAAGFIRVNPTGVVAGAESPREYLRRVLPPAPHYMDVASESGRRFAGGRTYVLGDIKAYYWKGSFVLDMLAHKPLLARWIEESDSPRRLAVKFRQRNVRHLACSLRGMVSFHAVSPGAYVWTRERLRRYQEFWTRHVRFTGERVSLQPPAFYYFFNVGSAGEGGPWPDSAVPFALPGAEALTVAGDEALLQGRPREAEEEYRLMARKYPGYVPLERRLRDLATAGIVGGVAADHREGVAGSEPDASRKAVR